jgi:hypothetical protein
MFPELVQNCGIMDGDYFVKIMFFIQLGLLPFKMLCFNLYLVDCLHLE